MSPVVITILLLTLSNLFMTFAWYAHLKALPQPPGIIAALVRWGIAFFAYRCSQVKKKKPTRPKQKNRNLTKQIFC